MIKALCQTNLDNYKKEKWPKVFCTRPLVGEIVESEDRAILKIVSITHYMGKEWSDFDHCYNAVPMLKIELHNIVNLK